MNWPPTLEAALAALGYSLPGPSEAAYAARLQFWIEQDLPPSEIAQKAREHHQLYDGMVEFEDELQAARQAGLARDVKPSPRPWASSPQVWRAKVEEEGALKAVPHLRLVESPKAIPRPEPPVLPMPELADIESACRGAKLLGWTREEVAYALRKFGAKWGYQQILSCPEENRVALYMSLTTIDMRRKTA
jgi:hypothetical protein